MIRSISFGAVINALIFIVEPHFGQSRGSTSYIFLIKRAQDRPTTFLLGGSMLSRVGDGEGLSEPYSR